jgi:hypothetical protein
MHTPEPGQVRAIAVILQPLVEIDRVVGGVAFAISRQREDGQSVLDLAHALEILLRTSQQGCAVDCTVRHSE